MRALGDDKMCKRQFAFHLTVRGTCITDSFSKIHELNIKGINVSFVFGADYPRH